MKTLLFLLGILSMILAIGGGIGIGIGALAYSIYLIVLMIKGTLVVTFFGIFKVVACWIFGPLFGWLCFAFFTFLSGLSFAASQS